MEVLGIAKDITLLLGVLVAALLSLGGLVYLLGARYFAKAEELEALKHANRQKEADTLEASVTEIKAVAKEQEAKITENVRSIGALGLALVEVKSELKHLREFLEARAGVEVRLADLMGKVLNWAHRQTGALTTEDLPEGAQRIVPKKERK
jgi:uncharacterized protein HemX